MAIFCCREDDGSGEPADATELADAGEPAEAVHQPMEDSEEEV